MAKVVLPLLSTEARGQLGKSIVYFPWKGINAVRTYIIPANPNTADQQAQRTILKNAVAEWHAAAYSDPDKTAWTLLASTLAAIMSGFNAMVRHFIDTLVAGDAWVRLTDVLLTTPAAGQVKVTVVGLDTDPGVRLHWGSSKTFFGSSGLMAWNAGISRWELTATGLPSGVIHYFWIKSYDATHFGRVGIYSKKTT